MTTEAFAKKVSHIAQAMAQVQQHKQPGADVSGKIKCPKCHSTLLFNIQPSGISRGRCNAACGVSWCQ
jgi:hypothetical protein